jgi:hypothetical protein
MNLHVVSLGVPISLKFHCPWVARGRSQMILSVVYLGVLLAVLPKPIKIVMAGLLELAHVLMLAHIEYMLSCVI